MNLGSNDRRRMLFDLSPFLLLLVVLGGMYFLEPKTAFEEADVAESDGSSQVSLLQRSPYKNRVGKAKQKTALEFGGSSESERAVSLGLEWLARHQHEDGYWQTSCLGRSPKSTCTLQDDSCRSQGSDRPVATTALPLLAMMASGHLPNNQQTYSNHVRRGLDWLISQQNEEGGIFTKPMNAHVFYEHWLASFALCEAVAFARATDTKIDPKYSAAAQKSIDFIEKYQHDDGGWRYSLHKGEASDTSVSGWSLLALKTCSNAELNVNKTCVSKAIEFFEQCSDRGTGNTGYARSSGYITKATTGVGLIVHHLIRSSPDLDFSDKAAVQMIGYARNEISQANDFYLWYNGTLGMFLRWMQDRETRQVEWDTWNNIVREKVISLQRHSETCQNGSWDPNDRWGGEGGRIYSTSLAILTLEVYYRYSQPNRSSTK